MPEVYISVDVETDGPVPLRNSMRSLGACVAGEDSGSGFRRVNPAESTWYSAMHPLDDAAPDLATLSWLEANTDLVPTPDGALAPSAAIHLFARFIHTAGPARGFQPVFVAYPLSFDWGFSHAYFMRFRRQDPFGFSRCLDIKTLYAAKAGCMLTRATKRHMPAQLTAVKQRHTHNALDDAIGQAELFANIMEWDGPRRH